MGREYFLMFHLPNKPRRRDVSPSIFAFDENHRQTITCKGACPWPTAIPTGPSMFTDSYTGPQSVLNGSNKAHTTSCLVAKILQGNVCTAASTGAGFRVAFPSYARHVSIAESVG